VNRPSGVNGPPGSATMDPVSTTQLADMWQARLDHWGRLLLLPLLGVATGLAAMSVAGGYGTWSHFDEGLVVISAAAVWSAVHTWRPGPARTERARAATLAVHLILAGLLVWVNPWYGVFAFSGYFFADDLRGRGRWAGFAGTAVVLAGSQAGGYPTGWSSHTVIYLVLVAVNLFAVSGFIILTNRVLEQNQERGVMIDDLADANRRLEATMAENAGLHAQLLVQAREAGVVEERQRLAGEIHDTLAQGLAGIVAQLEAAEQAGGDPAELSRHLSQARALARSSLTEARRSVRALRPEQLERASLPQAISELTRDWSARSAVPVELETTGTPTPLDPAIEATIFRVSQEALSNVAKHASASRVHLTLTYLHDSLLLDVADNGTGFDPAAHTGGYGLAGMRQRLTAVAGHLTVESTPGAGTTLNAAVPLARPPDPLTARAPAKDGHVKAAR
jgi:signal transduction histidine kinase